MLWFWFGGTYAPGVGILLYCDMLFEVTTIRLWHAGVCVQRISRATLGEAARPHKLSRSGHGVLGMVATRFGSAVNDWSCCIEQCWRPTWSCTHGDVCPALGASVHSGVVQQRL